MLREALVSTVPVHRYMQIYAPFKWPCWLFLFDKNRVVCYPACACAARGYVIGHGVYIYIVHIL